MDAEHGEDVLHVTRAVETGSRRPAPDVRNADEAQRRMRDLARERRGTLEERVDDVAAGGVLALLRLWGRIIGPLGDIGSLDGGRRLPNGRRGLGIFLKQQLLPGLQIRGAIAFEIVESGKLFR